MSSISVQQRLHRAALELFAQRGIAQVSVGDLAEAAGVARCTVYNHLGNSGALFEVLAIDLATEMANQVLQVHAGEEDPARRLATGIRLWLRRAHDEPLWGRFFTRFVFSSSSLHDLWKGPPEQDLREGVASGRYTVRVEQLPAVMVVMVGAVAASSLMILEGRRTWRDAAADAIELVLRALGVDVEEARALAIAEPQKPRGAA